MKVLLIIIVMMNADTGETMDIHKPMRSMKVCKAEEMRAHAVYVDQTHTTACVWVPKPTPSPEPEVGV